MGVWDGIAGSLASGLIGGVSSVLTSKSNKRLAREQMQFQGQEAAKEREWQSGESQKQRDWERQQWEDTNRYNSLSEVMRRITEAGGNPWMLAGDAGSVGTGGFADVPTSGLSPGGASASGVSAPYMGLDQSFSRGFSDIAHSLDALANARNKGIDTEYLQRTLEFRIKNQEARTAFQEIVTSYQDELTRRQLINLSKEYDKMVAAVGLIDAQTETEYSKKVLNTSQAKSFEKLARKYGLEGDQIHKFISEGFASRMWESQINKNNADARYSNTQADDNEITRPARINLINAQAFNNATQARLNQSLKTTEDELRKDKQKLLAAQAGLAWLDEDIAKVTQPEKKKALIQEWVNKAEQAGIITDQMRADLDAAIKANKWIHVQNLFSTIESGTRSFKNVADGISSLKAPFSVKTESGANYYDHNGNQTGSWTYWQNKTNWSR